MAARRRTSTSRSRPAASAQAAVMRLTSLAQLRVLSNPLRLKLLEAFMPEPRTTMQVARLLEESPTRLYRHVDALYQAGFLARRGRRKNRGTTETYYQSKAGRYEAAPDVFEKTGAGAAAFSRTVAELLRRTEQGLIAAEAAGAVKNDELTVMALRVEASPAAIARLRRRLATWIEDCTKARGTGASYEGLVAFYPGSR